GAPPPQLRHVSRDARSRHRRRGACGMTIHTELLHTPLHDRHLALGAKMVPFAGFEMPIQYSGIVSEHRAVRHAAGLFDLSHMGEFFFEGSGASAALDRLVSSDIAGLET